jgi:predicted DNA-binding transcriptional regulator YafY
MPADKNPSDRLFQLNEIFNNRFGANSAVTVKELEEKLGVKRSILFQDFEKLKALGAPLEYNPSLRGHRYTAVFPYADRILFTPDELAHLRIGVELLSKIHHLEGFQKLPSVFQKIRRAIRKWSVEEAPRKAIFFDPLPRYDGGKHLAFLLQAIENSWQVSFDYQPFHSPAPKRVVFDPCFLRHYDRRWYAGGFSHDPSEGFIRTFPLERIVGTPVQTGYFHEKPKDYNPDTYWKYIYGITIPPGGVVEDVELSFNAIQSKYFLTTPFFEPFEVLSQTPESLVVRLRLIPNFDLERKIGSYGADVKVLKPKRLAEKVKDFHQKALKQYEK